MDPQQSIALECTHMALEDGGIRRIDINGTKTGVFIGSMSADYNTQMSIGTPEESIASTYTLTGNGNSVISARVSYIYNLLGPSMTIDTACSSSLVAIHQGCMAIRAGDCNLAICGGVNYILSPDQLVIMSKSRISSLTGRCHTFSANADGYTRGEGCGIVVLKRYREAIRDGNKVWGVISTGCNQDGRTETPITAPSGAQQLNLLRDLYTKYNIDTNRIQYIEAHGTGTPRGDPTEVDSLGQHMSSGSSKERFIGSVKTNIGHLEAASGVAGLLKILLMMKYGQIVPHLHLATPNPKIDFEQYKFKVPTSCGEWKPRSDGKRGSCVNSFGFGGTNAHLIVEQSECANGQVFNNRERQLIVLTGPTKTGLKTSAEDFIEKLEHGQYNMEDVSHTSLHKRDHHPYRISVILNGDSTRDGLKTTLLHKAENCVRADTKKRKVIFVCGGVGTAWRGMCKLLIQRFSVFRAAIKDVSLQLESFCNVNLVKHMAFFDTEDPFLTHIAIFACQIALARLWSSFGLTPDCIIGQSVGEVAAAAISGALTLNEAVRVIYYRSKHLAETGEGRMFVCTGADLTSLQDVCVGLGLPNPIAVHLSPIAHTLSGSESQMAELKIEILKTLGSSRCKIRDLDTQRAYHTKYVHTAAYRLKESLDGQLSGLPPKVTVYSTVTTEEVCHEFSSPKYWMRNVAEPVKFQQTIKQAAEEGVTNIFVELGPSPVLRFHLKSILPDDTTECLPSMTKGDDLTLLSSLGRIVELGLQIIKDSNSSKYEITDIPKYCPKRQRNLRFTELSKHKREQNAIYCFSHMYVRPTKNTARYVVNINEVKTAFAYSHFVQGNLIFPGAAHVEAALAVGKDMYPSFGHRVTCHYKTFLLVNKDMTLNFDINKQDGGYDFEISDDNVVYASGTIRPTETEMKHTCSFDIPDLRSRITKVISKTDIYMLLGRAGFSYGPCYQLIEGAHVAEGEYLSELRVNAELKSMLGQNQLHPCILDACTQTSILLFSSASDLDMNTKIVPAAAKNVSVFQQISDRMFVYTIVTKLTDNTASFRIYLLNEQGGLVAIIGELLAKFVKFSPTDVNYDIAWQEQGSVNSNDKMKDGNPIVFTMSTLVSKFYLSNFPNASTHIVSASDNIDEADLAIMLVRKVDEHNSVTLHIIYQPGEPVMNGLIDPQAEVLQQCYFLILLVRAIRSLESSIVFSVITENAVLTNYENGKHQFNPIGYAIWGTFRCLYCEEFTYRYIIVDINEFAEVVSLSAEMLLGLATKGEVEIAIRNGSVYANTLNRGDISNGEPKCRESTQRGHKNVVIMSDDPWKIQNMFLNLSPSVEGSETDIVRVQAVTVHDKSMYPPTVTAMLSEQPTSDAFYGHESISLEFVGENIKGENIVACFPTSIRPSVSIPYELQLNTSAFRNYENGLLTKLVIATGLLESCTTDSCVSILIPDENHRQWEYILKVL